jgi:hypothetical protein
MRARGTDESEGEKRMSDEKPKHLTGEAFRSLDEAMMALNMPPTEYTLDEDQRQMILLAIARLAVERPGWDTALDEIAVVFGGREMFEEFKRFKREEAGMSDDFVWPTHCFSCGCVLMGGATEHLPSCEFRKMIEELANRFGDQLFAPDPVVPKEPVN